jgi:N6-L-threonylcarbamoyladenine synthase
LQAIEFVVDTALKESGIPLSRLGGIAVTCRPGLIPALLVGVSYAKGLALATGLPLVGVNHILAHVYGAFLEQPDDLRNPATFPLLALAVSGGHTSLIGIAPDASVTLLGSTIDDAAGEAFDKAAKILHLGYPGGPVIDRLAKQGNPKAVDFPRGLLPRPGHPVDAANLHQFSFSGVKTALLYHVRSRTLSDQELADVVASYQEAVVDVLVVKTLRAAQACAARHVVVCGGVACNSRLRVRFAETAKADGVALTIAAPRYCTDNAAMIAGLGYHQIRRGGSDPIDLPVAARLGTTFETAPFVPC